MQISFQTENSCFLVEFNNTPEAKQIIQSLPLDSRVSTWGDELFFETTISIDSGATTIDVNPGDVAFWPAGKSLCIFFGPTPFSKDNKPVPASPVIIVGRTSAKPEELKKIKTGHSIRLMQVQEKVAFTYSVSQPERKLSQSEIDLLVKQLLAEKAQKGKA